MPESPTPSYDNRWGDLMPWSLRFPVLVIKGDFNKFFSLLSEHLQQYFLHNEPQVPNLSLFGSHLASESLLKYQHRSEPAFCLRIYGYFLPATMLSDAADYAGQDRELQENLKLEAQADPLMIAHPGSRLLLQSIITSTGTQRLWPRVVAERLEVLDCLLHLLMTHGAVDPLNQLIRDIHRFAAASHVPLKISGNPPTLVPIEEPLLQHEVLDKLLPRLEATFPERARDLILAYRDLLKGVDANTVFANAFRALEELARNLTGNDKLTLSKSKALEDHFPNLHGTIRDTILKLAAHRGDEGGHGRKGPDEWEIRYLLLAICNVALLLLEYKEHCG